MPSAAGIIIATGVMTLANDYYQNHNTVDPTRPVASQINWKVIPATAIAAGIFYGFEQVNAKVATALAVVIFVTSFAFSSPLPVAGSGKDTLSPLGSLLDITGIHLGPASGSASRNKTTFPQGGLPYDFASTGG